MRTSRVVACITVALPATACSTAQTTTKLSGTPLPAVVTSATPVGWVPVDYGDAQISLPATFAVAYPGWACPEASSPGTLFVGPQPTGIVCPIAAPRYPSTTVLMRPLVRADHAFEVPSRHLVNGLLAGELKNHTSQYDGYLVPDLGVTIWADGPMAHQIVATLTRSPRTVPLAPGPAPSIPSGWDTVTFQGLSFAAPQSWPVTRTSGGASSLGWGCWPPGVAFFETGVTLSTDQHLLPPPSCPDRAARSGVQVVTPSDGLEVDSGIHFQFQVPLSFATDCLHLNGLIVCAATSPAYSILVLRVKVPRRSAPLLVSIGLAGSGMVARTILRSLREA